jgi:hypothetical protein
LAGVRNAPDAMLTGSGALVRELGRLGGTVGATRRGWCRRTRRARVALLSGLVW